MAKRKVTRKIVGSKQEFIGFRCDKQLASMLSGIENKSEYIIDAVLSKLQEEGIVMECPTCRGDGKVRAVRRLKKRD